MIREKILTILSPTMPLTESQTVTCKYFLRMYIYHFKPMLNYHISISSSPVTVQTFQYCLWLALLNLCQNECCFREAEQCQSSVCCSSTKACRCQTGFHRVFLKINCMPNSESVCSCPWIGHVYTEAAKRSILIK